MVHRNIFDSGSQNQKYYQKHDKVTERICYSKYTMAEERYALVFWIEDEQYRVDECKDIIGEVEINKTLLVAWWTKKKGSVVRNWYKATMLKFSGKV